MRASSTYLHKVLVADLLEKVTLAAFAVGIFKQLRVRDVCPLDVVLERLVKVSFRSSVCGMIRLEDEEEEEEEAEAEAEEEEEEEEQEEEQEQEQEEEEEEEKKNEEARRRRRRKRGGERGERGVRWSYYTIQEREEERRRTRNHGKSYTKGR